MVMLSFPNSSDISKLGLEKVAAVSCDKKYRKYELECGVGVGEIIGVLAVVKAQYTHCTTTGGSVHTISGDINECC